MDLDLVCGGMDSLISHVTPAPFDLLRDSLDEFPGTMGCFGRFGEVFGKQCCFQILFMKGKPENAMVQMGDAMSAERAIQHLNQYDLFGKRLKMQSVIFLLPEWDHRCTRESGRAYRYLWRNPGVISETTCDVRTKPLNISLPSPCFPVCFALRPRAAMSYRIVLFF